MVPISVSLVPERAKQAAEARRFREWGWAEGSIWADRMVSAPVTASKRQIANAPSRLEGCSPVAQPSSKRDTPDEETSDWRAVCGRTARTVRREGRLTAFPTPIAILLERLGFFPDRHADIPPGSWGPTNAGWHRARRPPASRAMPMSLPGRVRLWPRRAPPSTRWTCDQCARRAAAGQTRYISVVRSGVRG